MKIEAILKELESKGNYRRLPEDTSGDGNEIVDFSTNDYLGLATDKRLRAEFLEEALNDAGMLMSSSASRLLAASQKYHAELEEQLRILYGGNREVLLFNSGYHANTGILPAIADKSTLIVADKLVHASLIDGILLSRCEYRRFAHNDMDNLENIISRNRDKFSNIIIVTESVYSMDGDRVPAKDLVDLKKRYGNIILYLDEAHAFGVKGQGGLGMAYDNGIELWDIVVGTFGKAIASMGAFAVVSPQMKEFLVNRCRSLIFSTALPPLQMAWTKKITALLPTLDEQRAHLHALASELSMALKDFAGTHIIESHIQPLVTGDARKALALSQGLLNHNIKALAIRTPTVPAGTERLRFSLSAAMTHEDIGKVRNALDNIYFSL